MMTGQIKLNRRTGTAIVALSFSVLAVVYLSLMASASSSVVHDPKGDALSATESAHNVEKGTPEDTARAYMDIKSVKIKKKHGNYEFSMSLAGVVPQDMGTEICYSRIGDPFHTTTYLVNPPDPAACFFAWNWDVNDEDAEVGSNPIAPTVRWINGAFQGVAFSDSGPPVFFNTFTINGSKITATVDAAVIDAKVDSSDGFNFVGVSRNHRIDFGGDPVVGVGDFTDVGHWSE